MSGRLDTVDWIWYDENWTKRASELRETEDLSYAQIAKKMTLEGFGTKLNKPVPGPFLSQVMKEFGHHKPRKSNTKVTYTPEHIEAIEAVLEETPGPAWKKAHALNQRDIKTFQGKEWKTHTVRNFTKKYCKS